MQLQLPAAASCSSGDASMQRIGWPSQHEAGLAASFTDSN